jgi:hypothetical protein
VKKLQQKKDRERILGLLSGIEGRAFLAKGVETHLRSKKILVSKQLCCRMHNHMRATDLCHIALVYTYNQPRLNKPITISVLCEA